MTFVFKVWKVKIIIDLFDLDPSDKEVAFGVIFNWNS